MTDRPHTIRIAAALVEDDAGRVLLVRKSGTDSFMQPGGKIEPGETPRSALCRELAEEIGLYVVEKEPRYLGTFEAPAANEPGWSVAADLFHVRTSRAPHPAGEIAEAVWVDLSQAALLPLAPLTRHHVLPLAARLARAAVQPGHLPGAAPPG